MECEAAECWNKSHRPDEILADNIPAGGGFWACDQVMPWRTDWATDCTTPATSSGSWLPTCVSAWRTERRDWPRFRNALEDVAPCAPEVECASWRADETPEAAVASSPVTDMTGWRRFRHSDPIRMQPEVDDPALRIPLTLLHPLYSLKWKQIER